LEEGKSLGDQVAKLRSFNTHLKGQLGNDKVGWTCVSLALHDVKCGVHDGLQKKLQFLAKANQSEQG
jgi:hypothetical protein